MLNHYFLPIFCVLFLLIDARATTADRLKLDAVSAEQAKLEQQELAEKKEIRTLTDAMAEYRKTAEVVHYPSGERKLPGYLYRQPAPARSLRSCGTTVAKKSRVPSQNSPASTPSTASSSSPLFATATAIPTDPTSSICKKESPKRK